mmetsp:Transcript_38871/g.90892  ORF Transcript_38871/g.90892 Transcript_38871/m.90892 type:complete len:236 (+) Transcript_38871:846-1553(+)
MLAPPPRRRRRVLERGKQPLPQLRDQRLLRRRDVLERQLVRDVREAVDHDVEQPRRPPAVQLLERRRRHAEPAQLAQVRIQIRSRTEARKSGLLQERRLGHRGTRCRGHRGERGVLVDAQHPHPRYLRGRVGRTARTARRALVDDVRVLLVGVAPAVGREAFAVGGGVDGRPLVRRLRCRWARWAGVCGAGVGVGNGGSGGIGADVCNAGFGGGGSNGGGGGLGGGGGGGNGGGG